MDASFLHDFAQRSRRRNGRAADTGLVGEAVLEVGRVDNDLCAVVGHHQLAHIGGRLGRTGGDFFRDTDLVHHADVIDLGAVDVCRIVGERDKAVGDGYDLVSVVAVHEGIAQHAAVALTADALAVAVIVAGGRADKGNIDGRLAGLDGTDTAAVAAHDGETFQLAFRDSLPDLAAHTAGLDVGNRAILNHRHQRVMRFAEGTCADGDIFDAHLVNFLHDHVDDQISIAEMVVEAQRHAVVGTTLDKGLVDRADEFARVMVHHDLGDRPLLVELGAILIVVALKDFLAGDFQNLFRNFSAYCIFHITNPPYIRRRPLPVQLCAWHRRRTQCQSSCRPR